MYPMLDTQMMKASQADRAREARFAGQRRAIREARDEAPRRGGLKLRRRALVTATFGLVGGTR